MTEKYFEITLDKKELIIGKLKDALEKMPGLLFAYLHGSFIKGRFRDIDVAIYLKDATPSPLELELRLEAELGEAAGRYPVDVRILNSAPLSFRYNVIKDGQAIVVKDEEARSEFVEPTVLAYLDFAPFRKMYLQEALGIAA